MRRLAALVVLLLLPLSPAAADWIKTRDGVLIETRGPWKVKGSLVVFTAMNGALSSLRLSEVDLDASAVATAEARQPPDAAQEEPEEERPPVAVLTNENVPRAAAPAARAGEEDAGEAGSENEPPPPDEAPQTVEVISWRQVENPQIDGIEIHATIRNQGRDIATKLGVTVQLFDEDGVSLGTVNSFLGAISLAPGVTTTVRALFPEVYDFAGEPDFAVSSKTIQVRLPVTEDEQ